MASKIKLCGRGHEMRQTRTRGQWYCPACYSESRGLRYTGVPGLGAYAAAKTHCKHGHEFTEETTYFYVNKSGGQGRRCRVCHAQESQGRRLRKRVLQRRIAAMGENSVA